MRNIILYILILSNFTSFSQNAIGAYSTRELHAVEDIYYTEYTNEITGDLYLFDDWKKCKVNTNLKSDGLTLELLCNYNLFTDQFEMRIEDEIHYLKKENIVSIHENGKIYKPINSNNSEDFRNYMEILASGKRYNLASIHNLKIKDIPNKRALGIFKKNISKHFKLYIISNNTGKLIEVPKSKREIYKVLDLQKFDIKHIPGNIKKIENLKKAIEMT